MVNLGKMLRGIPSFRPGAPAPDAAAGRRVVRRDNRAAAADQRPGDDVAGSNPATAGLGRAGGWARPEIRALYGDFALGVCRHQAAGRRHHPPAPCASIAATTPAGAPRRRFRIRWRVCWNGSIPGTPAPTCGAPPKSTCACGGAAFWAIEQGPDGEPELWPLRPDRMAVIPDRRRYVRRVRLSGRRPRRWRTLPTKSSGCATSILWTNWPGCRHWRRPACPPIWGGKGCVSTATCCKTRRAPIFCCSPTRS